jgi:deoxycytidine triphosphate deaminase
MSLLVDSDLVQAVQGLKPIVTGLRVPADWYGSDSPIQPASVDLHVGEIYLPITTDPPPDKPVPLDECILEPGDTAVVTTAETLNLPSNVGAFGFPPTRISSKALLMTNPGHVDPGFNGRMRFTLINMGRKRFPLQKGDEIVTLLFLRTTTAPEADYAKRNPKVPHTNGPSVDALSRLARDFLDFRTQAESIAKKVVDDAEKEFKISEKRIQRWLIITTIAATVITAGGQCFGPVRDLEKSVATLSASLDVARLSRRLDSLQVVVDSVRRPRKR